MLRCMQVTKTHVETSYEPDVAKIKVCAVAGAITLLL